eukprot:TRINITY_DN20630_c0_g1_i1.p1 TRINITY_DN20630_c0_g1~~TRINITY_DN20630_c0_g1_i1.p1  ORF type:complete len:784 (+),score=142.00 TRINITY_DN20630_c0_g1_i1:378-2729(+)
MVGRSIGNIADEDILSVASVDKAAEVVIHQLVDRPCCFEPCMEYPSCKAYFQPADFATRDATITMGKKETVKRDIDQMPQFGYATMEQAGYTLLSSTNETWDDERVKKLLLFEKGFHQKSSTRVLILTHPKQDLEVGVDKTRLDATVRKLKQCVHTNVLQCLDVLEDDTCLRFVYEDFPCISLGTVLEMQLDFSQEQLVNASREILAATKFAVKVGLSHLGWTPYHVLFPVTVLQGDAYSAKVFGFGLMGILYRDSTTDRLFWSPEALQKRLESKHWENFTTRMPVSLKAAADAWSIGTLIYMMIAQRRPFDTETALLSKDFVFTVRFDMLDFQSSLLVGGLLRAQATERMRVHQALHHAWIRRHWQMPLGGDDLFRKMTITAQSRRANRVLNQFLLRFLDSDQWLMIARALSKLDNTGSGYITLRDLLQMASFIGMTPQSAVTLFEWLRVQGQDYVSIHGFALSIVEFIADGPCLRAAFAYIDEDGTEEINSTELFDALRVLDSDLTFDDIIEQLVAMEENALEVMTEIVASAGRRRLSTFAVEVNGSICFDEFSAMFSTRLTSMKHMKMRKVRLRGLAKDAEASYMALKGPVDAWRSSMEREVHHLTRAIISLANTKSGQTKAIGAQILKLAKRLRGILVDIPGAPLEAKVRKRTDTNLFDERPKAERKSMIDRSDLGLGIFSDFMLLHPMSKQLHRRFKAELDVLARSQEPSHKWNDEFDKQVTRHAADHISSSMTEVLEWVDSQLEELEFFVVSFTQVEESVPSMSVSLRRRRDETEFD